MATYSKWTQHGRGVSNKAYGDPPSSILSLHIMQSGKPVDD